MKHLATSPESCDGERPLPAAASASRISRKLVWSAAACGSSTVAHLVLLLALGLAMVSLPVREAPMRTLISEPERLPEELTARLPTQIQPAPPDVVQRCRDFALRQRAGNKPIDRPSS